MRNVYHSREGTGGRAQSGWVLRVRRVGGMLPILVFLGFLAAGMGSARAALRVVATTSEFGALAEAVGGKDVRVTVLARATEDPHFVDAKPSFVVALNRADVLIEGGAELEAGWLPALIQGSRNGKLARGQPGHIEAAQGIKLLGIPEVLDRSKGDIHASGNPHFMIDPVHARAVAERIAGSFAALDPEAADRYRANLAAFTGLLDARMAVWEQRMKPFEGESLVAFHDSWLYFARRFGLKLDLFLEPKPGIPPSPAHLARVAAAIRERGARVILVEPYVNRKTAERVAEETGARLVDVTHFPGGVKGTSGGYIELIDHTVNEVAGALESGAGSNPKRK